MESQGSPANFCEASFIFSILQHEAWAVQQGRTWHLSPVWVGLSSSLVEGSNCCSSHAPCAQESKLCLILSWSEVLHPKAQRERSNVCFCTLNQLQSRHLRYQLNRCDRNFLCMSLIFAVKMWQMARSCFPERVGHRHPKYVGQTDVPPGFVRPACLHAAMWLKTGRAWSCLSGCLSATEQT